MTCQNIAPTVSRARTFGEAQFTLAGRKRAHAIGKCNKKQLRERHLGTL